MLEAPTTSIYALNNGERSERKKEEADIEEATLDHSHINKCFCKPTKSNMVNFMGLSIGNEYNLSHEYFACIRRTYRS